MKSDNEDAKLKALIKAEVETKINNIKKENKKRAYKKDTEVVEWIGFIMLVGGIVIMAISAMYMMVFHTESIIGIVLGIIIVQLGIDFYLIFWIRKAQMRFGDKNDN